MSERPIECNADLDHPCDADAGKPCASCQAVADYWRRKWEHTGRREVERESTYVQDMIDAGRGHLLREGERP